MAMVAPLRLRFSGSQKCTSVAEVKHDLARLQGTSEGLVAIARAATRRWPPDLVRERPAPQ